MKQFCSFAVRLLPGAEEINQDNNGLSQIFNAELKVRNVYQALLRSQRKKSHYIRLNNSSIKSPNRKINQSTNLLPRQPNQSINKSTNYLSLVPCHLSLS